MEERIPKVSKKPLPMDAPAQTQVEKVELTVKRTPESEGKSSGEDILQDNTEHFFVTQVCTCPVVVIFMFLLSVGKYKFYNLWVYKCFSNTHGTLVPTQCLSLSISNHFLSLLNVI